MATEPRPRYTPDEYLAYERQSETKNEYLNGEILAMSGASRRHNMITGNVLATLHAQLRKGSRCEVYSHDMRVRVPAPDVYTYPDVVVACEPQFEDAELDTLLNPVLIVEVLSKSTEDYDRGTKFAHYRTIPSMSEYLVIAQGHIHVEHWIREADRWVFTETDELASTLELPSIGCTLALNDVYDRVFS